jgi:hypothetical protein
MIITINVYFPCGKHPELGVDLFIPVGKVNKQQASLLGYHFTKLIALVIAGEHSMQGYTKQGSIIYIILQTKI